jgi:hypothetical protein
MEDVRQELLHLQILTPELFSIFLLEVKLMMLTADLQAHMEPHSQLRSTHSNTQSLLATHMEDVRQKQRLLQTLILEQYITFQLEA